MLANGATFGGPYDTTTHTPNRFRIGPGVAPQSESLRPPRVRLHGLDERDRRRDRVVGRQRHGRHQHVARLLLRKEQRPVCGRGGQRSAVRHRRRDLGRQLRPELRTSPARPARAPTSSAPPRTSRLGGFPGFTLTLPTMPSPITDDQRERRVGRRRTGRSTRSSRSTTTPPPTTVDESLGCNVSDYPTPPNATSMAVTVRGVCARVGKAIRSQQAGYAAAAMVNNSTALPPFEGPIFSHPDTGEQFTVTIPFIGVRGPGHDADVGRCQAPCRVGLD